MYFKVLLSFLQPNSVAVMLFGFGGALGNFSYSYITGFLFDRYGVVSLMYILVQYSLTMLVLFVIMQVVAGIFGNRHPPDVGRNEEGEAPFNTLPLKATTDNKENDNLKHNDSDIGPLKV